MPAGACKQGLSNFRRIVTVHEHSQIWLLFRQPILSIKGDLSKVHHPSIFKLTIDQLPSTCFIKNSENTTCPAISAASDLDQLKQLFYEGAHMVAVYEDAENRKGFKGVIDWQGFLQCLEISVQVSAARMDSLLQSSYDAVCMIDEAGKVIFWNSQAENLYGIKAADIAGKDIRQFFDNLIVTEVLKNNVPVLGAFHQPRPGTYVLINAYPVRLHNRVIGSVSVEKDITAMVLLNRELIKANKRASFLEKEILKIGQDDNPFAEICGRSENFREVLAMARKVAATDAVVLLQGESGTGKEVLARALHRGGPRRDKPFIPINCGAIPYHLFESELFGYEGGAFTGAEKKGKPGKFALAHGGTLFLDEISELNPDFQVKLLRVLQDQVYYPVGGTKPCSVDVRIIAATNKDLVKLVEEGRFREDLYYRLNVVSIYIPPLRERKKDIPELAYYFLAEFAAAYQKKVSDIDPAVMTFFLRYQWPGNVRELRNIIERMVVLTEGDCLTMETLPPELKRNKANFQNLLTSARSLSETKSILERELIVDTLTECGGNKSRAAMRLGVPRSSLYYRIKKLGIREEEYLRSDAGY